MVRKIRPVGKNNKNIEIVFTDILR